MPHFLVTIVKGLLSIKDIRHNRETGSKPVRSRRCNWGARFGKVLCLVTSHWTATNNKSVVNVTGKIRSDVLIQESEYLLKPVPVAPRGFGRGYNKRTAVAV